MSHFRADGTVSLYPLFFYDLFRARIGTTHDSLSWTRLFHSAKGQKPNLLLIILSCLF